MSAKFERAHRLSRCQPTFRGVRFIDRHNLHEIDDAWVLDTSRRVMRVWLRRRGDVYLAVSRDERENSPTTDTPSVCTLAEKTVFWRRVRVVRRGSDVVDTWKTLFRFQASTIVKNLGKGL